MRRLLAVSAALGAAVLSAVGPLSSSSSATSVPAASSAAAETRSEPAPLRRAADPIPGQYIVTLDEDASTEAVTTMAAPEVEPLFTYTSALNGFAAELTAEQVEAVRAQPGVVAVEEDGIASATEIAPADQIAAADPLAPAASWGLDRIDQRVLPLDHQYNVARTGAGTTVYVVDSGIDFSHSEFGGRALRGPDYVGDGLGSADCNGHGTHVAGTVGGATYGVATQVSLVSVRVLGCDGQGAWSGIIAGFDWVAANARQPAVVNASLGGGYNQAANDAVDRLASRGVLPVVAAGNDSIDACQVSPASANWALTVGATDPNDVQSSFSNHGQCLEIYAPGRDILSARIGGGITSKNGTSMASPHVAGVAALYKSVNPGASVQDVAYWLIGQSTKGVLRVSPGSPNQLLFTSGL
ncbi:S8 family peptidase [Streptomyces sp. SBT349]|uniref:S8 family peptidase n=1 Tax=Streptomyces sp. SBT349 TaxID=1580539 RepID=UPI00099D7D80|nr:S8 family peptidase [Streptomyces sp. SBT349]